MRFHGGAIVVVYPYDLAHQIVDGINGVSRSTAPKEGL